MGVGVPFRIYGVMGLFSGGSFPTLRDLGIPFRSNGIFTRIFRGAKRGEGTPGRGVRAGAVVAPVEGRRNGEGVPPPGPRTGRAGARRGGEGGRRCCPPVRGLGGGDRRRRPTRGWGRGPAGALDFAVTATAPQGRRPPAHERGVDAAVAVAAASDSEAAGARGRERGRAAGARAGARGGRTEGRAEKRPGVHPHVLLGGERGSEAHPPKTR